MTTIHSGPLPPFISTLRAAIRSGNKTVTRRVLKSQPPFAYKFVEMGIDAVTNRYGAEFCDGAHEARFRQCKYGQPGQCRYMREPIYRGRDGFAYYRDDDHKVIDRAGQHVPWRWNVNVLAQIYMPAEYARTIVRIEDIHVERVQDMGWRDCLAEGIEPLVCLPAEADPHSAESQASAERQILAAFSALWDNINARRGYPWENNPWVWVVSFKLT